MDSGYFRLFGKMVRYNRELPTYSVRSKVLGKGQGCISCQRFKGKVKDDTFEGECKFFYVFGNVKHEFRPVVCRNFLALLTVPLDTKRRT